MKLRDMFNGHLYDYQEKHGIDPMDDQLMSPGRRSMHTRYVWNAKPRTLQQMNKSRHRTIRQTTHTTEPFDACWFAAR